METKQIVQDKGKDLLEVTTPQPAKVVRFTASQIDNQIDQQNAIISQAQTRLVKLLDYKKSFN